MRFFIFLFFLLILSSCQANSLSNWFSQWKDYSLTQLASQVTDSNLAQEDKQELLYLFGDIRDSNCSEMQYHIENNKTLGLFEKQFDLPSGFLFDELIDYNYEASLLKINRSHAETVVFSIVSVWKTEVSLEEIKELINKVRRCYPNSYNA